MSRKNAVKIQTAISESSGYHFKSCVDETSYVIASKHGLCPESDECQPYNDGIPNCCKTCNVSLSIANLTLTRRDNSALTPIKVFGFSNNDIAVVQVEERSYIPLKLGKLKENNGVFVTFGFKAQQSEPSRLLLNAPEIDGDECYFNIESNSTSELVEKSEDYYGISGSLVIDRKSTDIPVAYSVITTNEKSNDLSGDTLYDIKLDELHKFFGREIFATQKSGIKIDTSFKEYFNEVGHISVTEHLCVSVFVPKFKGFPFYNLTPIATALTNEFGAILGHENKNKAMLTVSALRVLEQKKHLQPAYKLLSSRMVESMMNAPHIYSTYIDHSHYHHVHLLNDSKKGVEFIISSFGGEGNLTEKINDALGEMVHNINHYSYNAKLISERAFLDMKYTSEECELLYEVLFGEQNDFIENISIMCCVNLQECSISKEFPIEQQVKAQVEKAISNIDSVIVQSIEQGLNVNLYVLPVNRINELTELVESILK